MLAHLYEEQILIGVDLRQQPAATLFLRAAVCRRNDLQPKLEASLLVVATISMRLCTLHSSASDHGCCTETMPKNRCMQITMVLLCNPS